MFRRVEQQQQRSLSSGSSLLYFLCCLRAAARALAASALALHPWDVVSDATRRRALFALAWRRGRGHVCARVYACVMVLVLVVPPNIYI